MGSVMIAALVMLACVPAGQPIDSTFEKIVPPESKLEKVLGGFQFVEGPIWTRDGKLIFSDIPANRLYVWSGGDKAEVFREPSFNANGNTLDGSGLLVTAEHGARAVSRTAKDGTRTAIAERFEGKRLNSPNDLVVHPNGDIYFTDPPYGVAPDARELDFSGVFRLRKDGTLDLLDSGGMRTPNGIAFSPDHSVLYVADSESKSLYSYPVLADGKLGPRKLLCDMDIEGKSGLSDGMRVDVDGRIYCTGPGGVQIIEPSGKRLGVVETPENATNCAWGDADGRTLYITAGTSVYRIRLAVAGLRP